MFKMLSAALLAVSLALPGAAQAQQARSNDQAVIGAIVGLGALAVIASQLSKKDKKKETKYVEPSPPLRDDRWDGHPGRGQGHGYGHDKGKGRDWGKGNHRPQPTVLSARCLTDVRARDGERHRILDRSCLRSSVANANKLPDRCEVSIKTRNGTARGYSVACVERQGFVIGRR